MGPRSPINIPAESEESHQGTSETLWEPLARQLVCLYSWKTLRLGPSLTVSSLKNKGLEEQDLVTGLKELGLSHVSGPEGRPDILNSSEGY